MTTDNRKARAAAAVRRKFTGPTCWWVGLTPGGQWRAFEHPAGETPSETIDGWKWGVVVGTFPSKRAALKYRDRQPTSRTL